MVSSPRCPPHTADATKGPDKSPLGENSRKCAKNSGSSTQTRKSIPHGQSVAIKIYTYKTTYCNAINATVRLHLNDTQTLLGGFPGGSEGKASACHVGDLV